jgi:hypothetical protein
MVKDVPVTLPLVGIIMQRSAKLIVLSINKQLLQTDMEVASVMMDTHGWALVFNFA